MIYRSYEHKSSHLISGIKTTFLSSQEKESTVTTNRTHFHWSGMSGSQSVSKVVNRRIPSPDLCISLLPPTWDPCPVTPSQLTAFNTYDNHPSTAKLQAAATLCAHSENRLWWGEAVDGAENTFLQCSLEKAQVQPLQGLQTALPRGEQRMQGGRSQECC